MQRVTRDDDWDDDRARRSMASPFFAIGGLALAVGAFFDWVSQPGTTPGTTDSFMGSQLSDGRIAMGIGVALFLMAVYMGTTQRYGHWFDSDLLGLALAAIATTAIVATWIQLGDTQTAEEGLYVSLAGGVVALIGAIVALAQSRREDDVRRDRTRDRDIRSTRAA